MQIGDDVKVFLKGESPWGTVVEIEKDRIKVRIESKLFGEFSEHEQARFLKQNFDDVKPMKTLHGRVQGDEIWCVKGEFDEWVDEAV